MSLFAKSMGDRALFAFFTSVLILSLLSCDPCDNLDCITDDYYGQFRIISKTDGKDLVFGPNAIYNLREIKFYSLNGTDTTFFQFEPTRFPGTGYDSILYVRFFPKATANTYMKLSSLDTDTLAITYNTFNTKCCGTITEIIKFRYNNSIDIPGNQGTQELRK
jgi:hypothetical protein